jgi:hypothetical protein
MVEMADAMRVMIMIAVITLEPAYEFVVLKNTWTRGEFVGVLRIKSRSPKVKQNVTSMINPREPLTTIDHIMDRGRTTPASFVSSAIVFC